MNDSISLYRAADLPRVAIIGRPNVGKSTIFNRLLGSRRAITDALPGVTRDPVESVCTVGFEKKKPFILIDTGGYRTEEAESLEKIVSEKSLSAAEQAQLILLVLDAVDITIEDEMLIEKMRPFAKKILLVVNKIDSFEREDLIWDFYRFGFSDVTGISAAHGRNFDALKEYIADRIGGSESDESNFDTRSDMIRLAILGKPNTGKSTLANFLTDTDNSIVSDIPGTTRDVIEGGFRFNGYNFHLLDTAGIRRKRSITKDVEYYSVNRAIKSIESVDIVFLLVDVRDSVTDQDKKIAAQIVKRGRGVIFVLNKWDLMEQIPNQFQAVRDRVKFFFPLLNFAPVTAVSATEGTGIKKMLNESVSVFKQLNTRIETPILNKKLEEWTVHYEPPKAGKKKYKIRYLTQVTCNPIRFVAFVNRKDNFPSVYIRYIQNRIREEFHIEKVPFSVELRER